MKLNIAFNNESRPGFTSGWGFSCVIDGTIMFDTGCDGQALLGNLQKLDISVEHISKVVLSHEHWDHTGGLSDVLNLNNNIDVYVLASFSEHLKAEIQRKARLKEVHEAQKIAPQVYTTGLIKNNPNEQALILKTSKGVVVIAGCSHPGVGRILDIAESHGKVHGIIGGLHGFSDLEALKGIRMIGACHCTEHIVAIKKAYPKQYREIRTGDFIEL
jgi:7,8-dihydropterin-6-yl-methyl-4-(beta-D-ribofuranosyl)aminobenzene 5'-phosphate synthase